MDNETERLLKNRILSRSNAIYLLERLNDPDFMDPEDMEDFSAMSNDELLENICSSGTIHDEDIDAVVDDSVTL